MAWWTYRPGSDPLADSLTKLRLGGIPAFFLNPHTSVSRNEATHPICRVHAAVVLPGVVLGMFKCMNERTTCIFTAVRAHYMLWPFCLSVRLSVCLSLTLLICVKVPKHITKLYHLLEMRDGPGVKDPHRRCRRQCESIFIELFVVGSETCMFCAME